MKKTILSVVLAAFVAGSIFAQGTAANAVPAMHTVGGGIYALDLGFLFLGGGLSAIYDYRLNKNFSIGGEAGWSGFLFTPLGYTYLNAVGKWFPWGQKFHVDLRLGYGSVLFILPGLKAGAAVGWRIDTGKPNGFVLDVGPEFDYYYLLGGGGGISFGARVNLAYAF